MKALQHIKILLASASPRRKELIAGLGLPYEIVKIDVDEVFDAKLQAQEIPLYLAALKANAVDVNILNDNEVVLTADTVVWVNNQVLNKPVDKADALRMLQLLNGNTHQVFTAVSMRTRTKSINFYDATTVHFNTLSVAELEHYLDTYQPYDKAGAYGIQEWIGYTAIQKIEGDFFNVMGLPISLVYKNLKLIFEVQ
ncbi:MAG: Maf family nucleotide pyrophosphatase [Bacteroidia bacterium]